MIFETKKTIILENLMENHWPFCKKMIKLKNEKNYIKINEEKY